MLNQSSFPTGFKPSLSCWHRKEPHDFRLPNNGHTVLPEATFRPKTIECPGIFSCKKSGVLGLSTVIFWKTCKLSNIKIKKTPGDSKRPFHLLVGGHLTIEKGHLTIPKRSQRIARQVIQFVTQLDPLIGGRLTFVKGVTVSPSQEGHGLNHLGGWCLLNAVSKNWKTSYQREQILLPGTIFYMGVNGETRCSTRLFHVIWNHPTDSQVLRVPAIDSAHDWKKREKSRPQLFSSCFFQWLWRHGWKTVTKTDGLGLRS